MSIQTINYFDSKASVRFLQSIHETGFALIEYPLVEVEIIKKAYGLWQKFFESSGKSNYFFDNGKLAGYVPKSVSEKAKGSSLKDIKEFYTFYPHAKSPKQTQLITMGIFHALNNIAETLLRWLESEIPQIISKNLIMPIGDMIEGSLQTALRITHYPPLTGSESNHAIRAAAHEDINFLSILPAATTAGLQVMLKSGVWQELPPDPNLIVVAVGDMLAECSQGYYQATKHRVINPAGEEIYKSRLAMCLYLHPRGEVRLSDRYTADQYLNERLHEIGLVNTFNMAE